MKFQRKHVHRVASQERKYYGQERKYSIVLFGNHLQEIKGSMFISV